VSTVEHPGYGRRDAQQWRIGSAEDVAWIKSGTRIALTIDSAIPPVFASYATIELRDSEWSDQSLDDATLLAVLARHSSASAFWLGYLDTGVADVVFPDAPRTKLYADWSYVFVQAGLEQAATWRTHEFGPFWQRGAIPDVLFPADRSWLLSTQWDDTWRCVGGPATLIDSIVDEPRLLSRRVALGETATPPGHQAR